MDTYHDPNLLIRAVNVNVPLPSVIAFRDYTPRSYFKGKAKNQVRRPAFTRRNVYLRDEYKCQYCSNMFSTGELSIDHVIPRCMGGILCWENAVTCCRECNGRKGCLLPSELHQVGLKLVRDPKCPTAHDLSLLALKMAKRRDIHPAWEPYLIWGHPSFFYIFLHFPTRRQSDTTLYLQRFAQCFFIFQSKVYVQHGDYKWNLDASLLMSSLR